MLNLATVILILKTLNICVFTLFHKLQSLHYVKNSPEKWPAAAAAAVLL